MDENNYIMWLSGISGLGNKRIKALIDVFGGAKNVWNAPASELRKLSWLHENSIKQMLSSGKNDQIKRLNEKMFSSGINFISIYDDNYPELLKQISDPPIGLYIKGGLPGNNFINISIIGSRISSEYGVMAAYELSKNLASNGFTIVSGMARGIDSMAHKGAIDVNGQTIAVLGNGLDICYPQENMNLMAEIEQNGCLISEYPPGTKPHPANFPARNRIISGLSRGLLVVEAAEKSGTNITVEQALEQGREIFAVPGSIFSKLSAGVNRLIKDGACLVTNYKDVLEGLGIDTAHIIEHNTVVNGKDEKETLDLSQDERTVYNCIGIEPILVEDIGQKARLDMQTVQFCLTLLEIKNCVNRLPGQRYIRNF